MVDLLLNQDPPADPNVEDAFDNTPIQKAAEFGYVRQRVFPNKSGRYRALSCIDQKQYGIA
jgi:hypothetical protein